MPIKDIFLLRRSEEFYLYPREDATIDLRLKKAPPIPNTRLTGQIVSCLGPVSGAVVQVFNQEYEAVAQTITDAHGNFFFIRELLPGKYSLVAAAAGYKTSKEYLICLSSADDFDLIIKLMPSRLNYFGTVYGTVIDGIGQILPYSKVVISDYSNPHIIKAVTHSTLEGDYLIYGLKPDKYLISAFIEGYEAPEAIHFEITANEILGIDISLYEIISSRSGTVSGKISYNGQDYPYAIAALYKIEENKQELVQIIESNRDGIYLFTNIPPGQYIVKSKIENIEHVCCRTSIK